jgi:putative SOS response-associated peptidase YedK
MCGRYVSPDDAAIEREFNLVRHEWQFPPSYNVAPTQLEWHLNSEGRKAPYYIHLADQGAFGFAALWDRSFKPDGTAIESVVHITLPANDLMKVIHNTGSNPHRMPAILRKEDQDAWLHGSVDDARAVLRQYDHGMMVAYEVSTRVNTPKNNDPALLAPQRRTA